MHLLSSINLGFAFTVQLFADPCPILSSSRSNFLAIQPVGGVARLFSFRRNFLDGFSLGHSLELSKVVEIATSCIP